MTLTEQDLRCIYCGTTKKRKELLIKDDNSEYCSNTDAPTKCIFQDIHISDLKSEINILILRGIDGVTLNKIKAQFPVCFMEDD